MNRLAWGFFIVAVACRTSPDDVEPSGVAGPRASSTGRVDVPRGMVAVPSGVLVMGVPEGQIPRVSDTDLPSVDVPVGAFFIDEYLFPNEAGTIPDSADDQEQASAKCAGLGKRLCTEVELERACKGPKNTTYPYGDVYDEARCGTGVRGGTIRPSGFLPECVSGFGVHDTHGTVASWTSSSFGRSTSGLVAIKGGNDEFGAVVGRCASARGVEKTTKSRAIGFRCCQGERTDVEAELQVVRGQGLVLGRDDVATRGRFLERLKADGWPTGPAFEPFAGQKGWVVERTWSWRPLGNTELLMAGGCARLPEKKACGLMIGRPIPSGLELVGFVSSGRWQPTVTYEGDPRVLELFGGDRDGAFRRHVAWDWGRLAPGPLERRVGKDRWEHGPTETP